ncbi:MAG: hypothetical protein HY093_04065 [Candidatus Liptonbacteria bacterium]|nr:hypothetical protein [Candidatus Liptonbacteria bacterium]
MGDLKALSLSIAGLAMAFLGGYLVAININGSWESALAATAICSIGLVGMGLQRAWKSTLGFVSGWEFDLSTLKKGKIYTLLAETFQKENQWLIVIYKPNGPTFAFYSKRSLKFILGDRAHFSVIEDGRIIPLDENGNKATKPSGTLPNETAVIQAPA